MKDRAVLIVRYENDANLFKNAILTLSNTFRVYVYDNSKESIKIESNDIYYFHDPLNSGLARALNHCVDQALFDNVELMIYFDQDSVIDEKLILSLTNSYIENKIKYENLSILGPQPVIKNTEEEYPIKLHKKLDKNLYTATEIITSGMTFEPQSIKKLGYFDEALFLDMVDFEMCWRAIEQNKLVLVDTSIKMPHEVGVKTIKLPFKVLPISSPVRNYYQMRNVLYLAIYKQKKNKLIVLYYILRRFANVLINLLFADKRIHRLKYNILGIKDAFKKNMGKLRE